MADRSRGADRLTPAARRLCDTFAPGAGAIQFGTNPANQVRQERRLHLLLSLEPIKRFSSVTGELSDMLNMAFQL